MKLAVLYAGADPLPNALSPPCATEGAPPAGPLPPRPALAEGGPAFTWEQIYAAHFDFVWRSLRRLGVAEPNVDDATQDVFLIVFRRLGEFEERSSIKTWLFGIAYHVARRSRQRFARACTAPPELLQDTVGPAAPDPQSAALRSEAKRIVYRILDSMPADKRDVFVMAELEQMSAPEIAEIIDISVNTVYSRLRSARRDFEAAARREQGRQARRKP